MKKTAFCAFLIVVMLASSAWAQSISLGVKAGLNLARASADAGMTIAAGNGLLLGAYAELSVFPPLVLQVGVQYAEHKTSVSLVSPLDSSTSSVTHQLNYLEIPIDLKLAIGPPTFQIFGLVGISVGVLMKAVNLASGSSGTETSDYKDSLNKTALAFQVGAGSASKSSSMSSSSPKPATIWA